VQKTMRPPRRRRRPARCSRPSLNPSLGRQNVFRNGTRTTTFTSSGPVLALVLMVACNYVTDSHVWLHLKDRAIDRQAGSAGNDRRVLLHQPGEPWHNVPWLFQWFHAFFYDFVYGLVPVDQIDPTGTVPRPSRSVSAAWLSSMP